MRDIVYLNGNFVERSDAKVSVEDRGFQFADGIYEVVRFHGRRGLRFDSHLERLAKSAQDLRYEGVLTSAEWHDIVAGLQDQCEISEDDDTVYWLYQQVTRGDSPRIHVFPPKLAKPTSVAYFGKVKVHAPELRENGIALATQPDERWERCYIKSVCLLPIVLAKQAAVEQGAFEALLVRDGLVTEGGSTNVFCVIDGAVHTHPEGGHILSGVTRDMVLEAADTVGIQVVQRPVPLKEFRAADEAFISSTTLDIMPATKLDGQPVGDGKVGPVTKKLAAELTRMVKAEIG